MPNKKTNQKIKIQQNFILASASPRRKQLLRKILKNNFKVIVSNYPENNSEKITPLSLAKKHSENKALSVYRKIKEKNIAPTIIISADTIVVCKNKILGKPKSKYDAKRMLNLQSNKTSKVITAVTILKIIDGKIKNKIKFHNTTKVKMKRLSNQLIDNYIKTGECFGKAGAFAVQQKGGKFIEKVIGDYDNVVGLPVQKLKVMLKKI